ncbi:hypothetical protein [Streptacidiphilus sp. ASG 303]|uniref:hypothetical protein n=1 Tax=Streptomycetaceae TaxID=2062 RepID=UPI001E2E8533|nr:hypothetical protein [Streptacidiphilus sp. ASG 303]MCD0483289.1 hypothetical protein [Streptacidiphilus sp. ASG 303]
MSESVIERGVEMSPGDPACEHVYGTAAEFGNLYACSRCGHTSWDGPALPAAAVPFVLRRPIDALDV